MVQLPARPARVPDDYLTFKCEHECLLDLQEKDSEHASFLVSLHNPNLGRLFGLEGRLSQYPTFVDVERCLPLQSSFRPPRTLVPC